MASWFLMINILLLLSSSLIQARYRGQSKRRYSISTPTFVPSIPIYNNNDNNNLYVDDDDDQYQANNDQPWIEQPIETTSTPAPKSPYQASDEQVEQFTRLLIDRLNLKEAPNVTVHVNDDTGLPPSIFKQLGEHTKEQLIHEIEENQFHRQQKINDDVQPTAERAILPGDSIPNHTCKQQLSAKLNLAAEHLQHLDCFRFMKSPKDSNNLPTNQRITGLRLYVKRNYFNINDEQEEKLTPDMFQIYQVFRPTSNDTTHKPPPGLTGTARLSIHQIKELNDHWFELTVEPNSEDINILQLYKQLIMPWYALAIDRDLETSPSMSQVLPSLDRHYYRQYHSKKHHSHQDGEDQNSKESQQQQQLPYMLVEYGDKIYSSSSGRRGTRNVVARPAHGCHPTSPCCRRSLTIDLDQGSNALNFVIYPRQLDIGECVGLCGPGGSSLRLTDVKNAQQKNAQNSAYNLLLLQSSLHSNRSATTSQINRGDYHSSQCCSYSRTGGLELMYTTTNGGPIISKNIPNMVVEECKCGLPATIQQV